MKEFVRSFSCQVVLLQFNRYKIKATFFVLLEPSSPPVIHGQLKRICESHGIVYFSNTFL